MDIDYFEQGKKIMSIDRHFEQAVDKYRSSVEEDITSCRPSLRTTDGEWRMRELNNRLIESSTGLDSLREDGFPNTSFYDLANMLTSAPGNALRLGIGLTPRRHDLLLSAAKALRYDVDAGTFNHFAVLFIRADMYEAPTEIPD